MNIRWNLYQDNVRQEIIVSFLISGENYRGVRIGKKGTNCPIIFPRMVIGRSAPLDHAIIIPYYLNHFLVVLQSPNNFPQNFLLDHPQWAGVKMNQETSVLALETQLSLDAHYESSAFLKD